MKEIISENRDYRIKGLTVPFMVARFRADFKRSIMCAVGKGVGEILTGTGVFDVGGRAGEG